MSTFSGLSDINSSTFGRIVVILETLARYRSCVVMLDLECDDLIKDMFDTFFTVARYDSLDSAPYFISLDKRFFLSSCHSIFPYFTCFLGRDRCSNYALVLGFL